ncbi:hypothetical protein Scep_012078 [Stephania cephalantha]|uniref:Uncharacterized protein n=1 Tax=Stephania cephalantha TaxID=152367 RepID=A0AAP0P934_9MAGN
MPPLAETTWEQGEPFGGVGLWAPRKINVKRGEAQINRAQVFTGNTQRPNYMISSWNDSFVADLLAIAIKYDSSPAQLNKSNISNLGETTMGASNQTNSDFLDELDIVAEGYDRPAGNDGLLRREETKIDHQSDQEGQSDNGVEIVIIDEYNSDLKRGWGSSRSSEIEETASDWGNAQDLDMDVEEWNGERIVDTFEHDTANPRDQNTKMNMIHGLEAVRRIFRSNNSENDDDETQDLQMINNEALEQSGTDIYPGGEAKSPETVDVIPLVVDVAFMNNCGIMMNRRSLTSAERERKRLDCKLDYSKPNRR